MPKILLHCPNNPIELSNSYVQSVLELTNDQLLVENEGNGIDLIDRQRGLIDAYRTHRNGLPDTSVMAMQQTPDSTLCLQN